MKDVVLFTGIWLILICISSCVSIEEKCKLFEKKLLKFYRNIHGDALRNYNNSLYKTFVTMVTMSKMSFILKTVNAH